MTEINVLKNGYQKAQNIGFFYYYYLILDLLKELLI